MEPPSTAGNGKRHVAPRGGRARVAPPPGLGAVEWTQLAVAAAYVAATAGLEWLVGRRGASLDVAFAPARGDLFSAKSVATAHALMAVIASVMFFQGLVIRAFTRQPHKRRICAGVSLAAFMHCVTFTAWALNWLTAVKAPSGDYLVLHRTLLWTASTCALIAVLTSMVPPSGARRAVLGPTVGADVCMMLFGAAEHALPNPARALFLTLACGLFVVTVRGQMVLLRMAAEELDDEEDVAPLLLMRRTLVATWSTYPLLRLAFHAGVVSANSQEVLNCCFDILTKMGYTTILWVCTFEVDTAKARRRSA